MVKADSKPVSEKELEDESEIEEVIEKDGAGYGDLQSLNAQPDETNRDAETYVGRPAAKESETYIHERKSYSMGMTDHNKLKNTKIGDHINYYDNGVSGSGIVTKMSGQFIQIFKEDGQFYDINVNDTFHVADILVNKSWDDMDLEERTNELMKIKAYSPRFLSKTWDQLPRELRDVMKLRSDDWDKQEKEIELDEQGKPKTFDDKRRVLHRQGVARTGTTLSGKKLKKPLTVEGDAKNYGKIYERQNESLKSSKRALPSGNFSTEPDTEQTKEGQATKERSRDEPPQGRHRADFQKLSNSKFSHVYGEGNKSPIDKSSIEDGAFGNTGSSPTTGVSTKIPFDAPKDYEGQTHETKNPDREFQYEDKKPEVGKEKPAPEVKLDEQGLVKAGAFVYSDNPNVYKLPPQPRQKGYGIKYGVKYINEEEDN